MAGVKGNCVSCYQVPTDVKEKVITMLEKTQMKKEAKKISYQNLMSDVHVGEEDEEDPEAEGYYRQNTC